MKRGALTHEYLPLSSNEVYFGSVSSSKGCFVHLPSYHARAIDSYWQDKEKPPANLQELVSAGYLREVPKDPVCPDCEWNQISAPAEDVNSAGGVGDVKSSAPGEDTNGKSYAEY